MTRQEQEELVCSTFIMAIRVVQSLDFKVDEMAALNALKEVANGSLTLYDSAQRETAILEGHIGPMSPEQRAARIASLDRWRFGMDTESANLARMILAVAHRTMAS